MAQSTAQENRGGAANTFDSRFRHLADRYQISERVRTRLDKAKTEVHLVYEQPGRAAPKKIDRKDLGRLWRDHRDSHPFCLIVNNIDHDWLRSLGCLCGVDERVFLVHLWNATKETSDRSQDHLMGSGSHDQDAQPHTNRFLLRRCANGAEQRESILCLSFAPIKPLISKWTRSCSVVFH